MKVVILAGGKGTRISEESYLRPKPMIEIGDMPILWHIMKMYSYYGYNEFIICCGYKGYMIKEYFANYYLRMSDVTFDLKNENKMFLHHNAAESWKVTLVDTGLESQTGYRIKKIQPYISPQECFMLTYGDGVADVDIQKLLQNHMNRGRIATITAVQPTGKYGMLDITESGDVSSFIEKPKGDGGWINGGFMVLNYAVFDFLAVSEDLIFEREPLEALAQKRQLNAYKHYGFWKAMDTMRDKDQLNEMWEANKAPWRIW
mgnify:CR=1 FL=1